MYVPIQFSVCDYQPTKCITGLRISILEKDNVCMHILIRLNFVDPNHFSQIDLLSSCKQLVCSHAANVILLEGEVKSVLDRVPGKEGSIPLQAVLMWNNTTTPLITS